MNSTRIAPCIDLTVASDDDIEALTAARERELSLPCLDGGRDCELRVSDPLPYHPQGYRSLPQLRVDETYGDYLKVGDTVEFGDGASSAKLQPGDFGRIRYILQNNATKMLTLRVEKFSRLEHMKEVLPDAPNEVCMIQEQVSESSKSIHEQSMIDVALGKIRRKRRLILTNELYPAQVAREIINLDPRDEKRKRRLRRNGPLVCRWVSMSCFDTIQSRNTGRIAQSTLRLIHHNEADKRYAVPEIEKYRRYRGSVESDGPSFTFGDAFCGCGGVSAAASMAGLDVQWGFDKDASACMTYLLNQNSATILNKDVAEFIEMAKNYQYVVSMLHISPPCQAFSPANARSLRKSPGSVGAQNDEMNSAALFAVGELIERVRPRVVTLEQTSGLYTHECHKLYYHALLCSFTSRGYSVSSRLVSFEEFGAASRRKRLILFASCPGEPLPQFPNPSHGPRTGISYTTIDDVIGHLSSRHHDRHNPGSAGSNTGRIRTCSRDGLLHTITRVPDLRHPSGRAFTPREFAQLMGFPDSFKFCPDLSDKQCVGQIGNAVPPQAFARFLTNVAKSMEETDLERAKQLTQTRGNGARI